MDAELNDESKRIIENLFLDKISTEDELRKYAEFIGYNENHNGVFMKIKFPDVV